MPDKIMKTLTVGDTTYTINDGRVDSLQDEVDDKLDAPASAGTSGQVLALDGSGNPVWQNAPSGLPSVTASDNNKVLKVTNGAWAAGAAPTELPAVSATDNGKVLKVTSGAWAKGTVLPSVTTSDNGKVLKVVSGAWSKGTVLPSVTTSDNDKVLTVKNGVWGTGDPPGLPSTTSADSGKVLMVQDGNNFPWIKSKINSSNFETHFLNEYNGIKSNVATFRNYFVENVPQADLVFVKGTLNEDGTIDRSGNGAVSLNIIQLPLELSMSGNTTDIDSLQYCIYSGDGIYDCLSYYETDPYYIDFNNFTEFSEGLACGVRICFAATNQYTVDDDGVAQYFAEQAITSFTHVRLAPYTYVDKYLDRLTDALFKRMPYIDYYKGSFNVADGTYDSSSNTSFVSDIIDIPFSVRLDPGAMEILYGLALYSSNGYLGKISEYFSVDNDPSTGFYAFNSYDRFTFQEILTLLNESMWPYYSDNIAKIRIIPIGVTRTISNNTTAANIGNSAFVVEYPRFANRSS